MRNISVFLLGLVLLGCHQKNSFISEREFAQKYMKVLKKQYPTVSFELDSDLSIKSKKAGIDYKHYIDNAYVDYKAEPDSLEEIIKRYAVSTGDLYTDQIGIDLKNIVPVIKPIEYLDKIDRLNKDSGAIPMVTEKYNNRLIIAYAEDSKNSIKYLTEIDFKGLSISKDSLKSIALRNLDKILTNIQREGGDGVYMITAGGNYEASLILLSSIWTKENFIVDGEFVVAIPNRDMLLITGSNNKQGIAKLRKITAESYNANPYQISEYLYIWTGKKFEKLD